MAFRKTSKLSKKQKPIKTTESLDSTNTLNQQLRSIYLTKSVASKPTKHKKRTKKDFKDSFIKTDLTFSNIGGMSAILNEVKDLVIYPLRHPHIFKSLGVVPPKGILFHGPSGGGKTLTAMAAANEANAALLRLSATEIIGGVSGEAESNLRDAFMAAKANSPCVVLIEQVDVICPGGDSQRKSMERRIAAQLVSCLDDLNTEDTAIVVICTTTFPENLDKSLRRGGRLDREIEFGAPDCTARLCILRKLSRKMKLEKGLRFEPIASRTTGFMGADLSLLLKEAAKISLRRIFDQVYAEETEGEKNPIVLSEEPTTSQNLCIDLINGEFGSTQNDQTKFANQRKKLKLSSNGVKKQIEEKIARLIEKNDICVRTKDFSEALSAITPSLKRKGFNLAPKTTWEEIGGLRDLREELKMSVVYPVQFPELFERQGLSKPTGILLYGPPGCGKTLVARAVANEAHASFISVKGPELLNSLVGETEKSIRSLFARAYMCAPCIIFFDEVEALAPRRMERQDSSEISLRVVTQLLTEMDGLEERNGVFVIAASNRPDLIDRAILRPGRIGRTILVPLPNRESREEILFKHILKMPCRIGAQISKVLSEKTEGFSGADCADLVQRASRAALSRHMELSSSSLEKTPKMRSSLKGVEVETEHFMEALAQSQRSVSKESKQFYDEIGITLNN